MKFIKDQLEESRALGGMTDKSRKDFIDAQEHFQNYMATQDNKELQLYFQLLKKLKANFNKIEKYEDTNPKLKNNLVIYHQDTFKAAKLKSLIDSVYHILLNLPDNIRNKEYIPTKYKNDFKDLKIQTSTYADTIKKKGFFRRLKDAVIGKVDVYKESTVITITNNKPLDLSQVNSKLNNTIKSIDKYYAYEIKKVQLRFAQDQEKNLLLYSSFSKLLVYSDKLIEVYNNAIKDFKAELEKEYNQQSFDNSRIRNYLVLGLMFLMFIVSILIMDLTKIAFIYEQKVNIAHKEIKKNLNFKNRILGMLSHDLRSPLMIINIFIDKIQRSTEDRTIKDYLKSIKFINSTLLLQSNQILEYTKNEDAKKELIKMTFNLKDEICSIIKVIKPYLETRNNKIVVTNKIPEI